MRQTQNALHQVQFEQQLSSNPFAAFSPAASTPTFNAASDGASLTSPANPFLVADANSAASASPFGAAAFATNPYQQPQQQQHQHSMQSLQSAAQLSPSANPFLINAAPAPTAHSAFGLPAPAPAASDNPFLAAEQSAQPPMQQQQYHQQNQQQYQQPQQQIQETGPYSQTFNAMTFSAAPAAAPSSSSSNTAFGAFDSDPFASSSSFGFAPSQPQQQQQQQQQQPQQQQQQQYPPQQQFQNTPAQPQPQYQQPQQVPNSAFSNALGSFDFNQAGTNAMGPSAGYLMPAPVAPVMAAPVVMPNAGMMPMGMPMVMPMPMSMPMPQMTAMVPPLQQQPQQNMMMMGYGGMAGLKPENSAAAFALPAGGPAASSAAKPPLSEAEAKLEAIANGARYGVFSRDPRAVWYQLISCFLVIDSFWNHYAFQTRHFPNQCGIDAVEAIQRPARHSGLVEDVDVARQGRGRQTRRQNVQGTRFLKPICLYFGLVWLPRKFCHSGSDNTVPFFIRSDGCLYNCLARSGH
jgi:hypothetical protein